jgi:hypothetical protein
MVIASVTACTSTCFWRSDLPECSLTITCGMTFAPLARAHLDHFLDDRRRAEPVGPAGIERQMTEYFAGFLPRQYRAIQAVGDLGDLPVAITA